MKLKARQAFVLILTITIFQLVTPGFGQEPQYEPQNTLPGPLVVRKHVPTYPDAAANLNIEGTVVIAVKINAVGKVISTKYAIGPSALRTAAETSAWRWRFNAVKARKLRTVYLIFDFRLIPSNTPDQDSDTGSPYAVEIRREPSSALSSEPPREPPAVVTADSADPSEPVGDIGVPECDAYLRNYETCVFDKLPETMRATFKASMLTTRKSWKKLAANPQTRPTLAAACRQATESAKVSLAAYGCSW